MQTGPSRLRETARSGEEQDVISKHWRQWICRMGRPGVSSSAKRAIRRRLRKVAKKYDDFEDF